MPSQIRGHIKLGDSCQIEKKTTLFQLMNGAMMASFYNAILRHQKVIEWDDCRMQVVSDYIFMIICTAILTEIAEFNSKLWIVTKNFPWYTSNHYTT